RSSAFTGSSNNASDWPRSASMYLVSRRSRYAMVWMRCRTGRWIPMTVVARLGAPIDDGLAGESTVLDVRDLRMRYGTTAVLTGVSFTARPGEVLALLGPNGAGKTTTIEILEGFRLRSAGHVRVLGADPAHGDERWRARLGVVLQSWRDHGKWRP